MLESTLPRRYLPAVEEENIDLKRLFYCCWSRLVFVVNQWKIYVRAFTERKEWESDVEKAAGRRVIND